MPIFRTFFHGRMSGIEITCLRSFLDYGHRVVISTYDNNDVPGDFEKSDASLIIPRERLFAYQHGPGAGSYAAFSNHFRYLLLQRHGDWWVDTDVLCLTADWPAPKGGTAAARQDETVIGTAVLALPQTIAALAADRCDKLGRRIAWGQAGPALMTRIFQEHGMTSHVLPPSAFYPVHWDRWRDPFDAQAFEGTMLACKGSVTLHLWHELMRRAGFEKSWLPPPDTFFGQAVQRHGTAKHFVPIDVSRYRAGLRRSPGRLRRALSWFRPKDDSNI